MKLTVYVGKMGAGKTTLAFKDAMDFKAVQGGSASILSFADPLKTLLRDQFQMTKEPQERGTKLIKARDIKCRLFASFTTLAVANLGAAYFQTVNNTLNSIDLDKLIDDIQSAHQEKDVNSYKVIYRRVIQFLGTDIGRVIHPDFWSILLLNKIKVMNDSGRFHHDQIFVDDLRFLSEFRLLDEFAYNADIDTSYKVLCTSDRERRKRLGLSAVDFKALSKHPSELEVDKIIRHLDVKRIPYTTIV